MGRLIERFMTGGRVRCAAPFRRMAAAYARGSMRRLARRAMPSLLAFSVTGHAWSQDANLEVAVKATYLCKLAEFVTWPSPADASPSFDLCVVGLDPFGPILDRAAQSQTVHQKPIVVRRYEALSSNPGCHLIFAAGSKSQPVAATLAAVNGTPVLTVTDGQTSPVATGIVNLMIVDGRVRFEIDQAAAVANHLVISSKLLSIAVQVRGQALH